MSTVIEGTANGAQGLLAPALPSPSAARSWHRAHAASAVHALLFFCVGAVVAGIPTYEVSLFATTLAACVWFVSLTAVRRSSWLSPRMLGIPIATALGTTIGLISVSVLAFWVPASGFGQFSLLAMATGIFLVSAAYQRVAFRALTPPRRVLILGGGPESVALTLALNGEPLRFDCTGIVSAEGEDVDFAPGLVLGENRELERILALARPEIVVLANDRANGALSRLLDHARAGFRVVGLTHFYEHAFGRVPVANLSPLWFLSVIHLNQRPYPKLTKRLLDIALATTGFLLTAPLWPIIAWLVHRSSPGPVLYRQRRLGEAGETFEMLKFRTMVDGAEKESGARWAETGDPRITRFGCLLRRTRMDELPQLWNVLRGEMSIVGPRPERPEFLRLLEAEVPFWARRLLIKPGITGWAQVRAGYASDIGATAEKLSYDLFYLKHRSLLLDLAIALLTVRTVVSGHGAQ
jgi:exopolysaccharide biosynthesis polyprenyl glycosylphosphotransferase